MATALVPVPTPTPTLTLTSSLEADLAHLRGASVLVLVPSIVVGALLLGVILCIGWCAAHTRRPPPAPPRGPSGVQKGGPPATAEDTPRKADAPLSKLDRRSFYAPEQQADALGRQPSSHSEGKSQIPYYIPENLEALYANHGSQPDTQPSSGRSSRTGGSPRLPAGAMVTAAERLAAVRSGALLHPGGAGDMARGPGLQGHSPRPTLPPPLPVRPPRHTVITDTATAQMGRAAPAPPHQDRAWRVLNDRPGDRHGDALEAAEAGATGRRDSPRWAEPQAPPLAPPAPTNMGSPGPTARRARYLSHRLSVTSLEGDAVVTDLLAPLPRAPNPTEDNAG